MTISSELRKAGPFAGNGATTAFPFSFKVFAASDVAVTRADTLGAETALVLNSDFTVALNPDQDAAPGGTVTLAAPLATGHRLAVTSVVPNLQPTDITNNGGFYPRVIEDALDRHVVQIQQIDEKVARALKVGITSPLGSLALPAPVAGTVVGWNNTNDGLVNYPAAGDTLLAQMLEDGTANIGGQTAQGVADLRGDLDAGAGASLVGFKQVGTGAVVRTAQDKLREWVSVKDFGAVGDGVADDTLAVQAALNAVPNGGTVIVDGLFKITSTVTISKSLKLLGGSFGYGSLRTGFINETDTALKMFAIRAHYVSFEKLLISGAGKAGTSVAIEVGDGVTNYDKFSFSNDAAVINFRYGIVLRSQNCAVRGGATLSNCGTGVHLAGVPGVLNNRNIYFNEANLHSCDVGIETTDTYYAVGITGCDFNSCYVDAIKGSFYSSSIVGNNFIYSGEDDIDITSASIGGVQIVGNALSGFTGTPSQGTGIKISGNYCSVVGNSVTNKPGDGINVSGVGNTISSNSVVDANYFDAAGFSNIKIAGNINRVIGNVSRTTTGGASLSEYGVHVVSGLFNIVALNRVDGNKLAQIRDDASSLVRLNQGFATDAKGSATIPAASTSVVVNHGLAITPPTGSIQLTLSNNSAVAKIWVSGVTSTQFTINCNVAPGGSGQTVEWSVV